MISPLSGFLAHVAGGYAAGKFAGTSGGLNGAMTAVFGLIMGIILGIAFAIAGIIFTEGVAMPPASFVGLGGLACGPGPAPRQPARGLPGREVEQILGASELRGKASGAWQRSPATRRRALVWAMLVAWMVVFPGGCGAGGGSGVAVLEVDAPLMSPVWDWEGNAVIALRQNSPHLVKADVEDSGPLRFFRPPQVYTVSKELEGAGENLTLDLRVPDNIFVPQPELDRVVAIKNELVNVRSFEAGNSPARVAVGNRDALAQRQKTLYAISEDSSMVTGVNLENHEVVARVEVNRSEEALIEAPREGAGLQFWIAGPEGVAFYGSPEQPFSEERPLGFVARTEMSAGALALDANDPRRAYAAEAGTGRVVAVEPGPDGRLEIVAGTKLDGTVEQLASEEERVYAASEDSLFVLDAQDLGIIGTVRFAGSLQEEDIGRTRPSGMAVGGDYIYLTLEDKPYMVQIEEP